MRLLIGLLILVWLSVLTVTQFLATTTDKTILTQLATVFDDNLKNQVRADGKMYYVVGMMPVGRPEDQDPDYLMLTPAYMDEEDLTRTVDRARRVSLKAADDLKLKQEAVEFALLKRQIKEKRGEL